MTRITLLPHLELAGQDIGVHEFPGQSQFPGHPQQNPGPVAAPQGHAVTQQQIVDALSIGAYQLQRINIYPGICIIFIR